MGSLCSLCAVCCCPLPEKLPTSHIPPFHTLSLADRQRLIHVDYWTGWSGYMQVVNVVDGDTLDGVIWDHQWRGVRVRLSEINAPELKPRLNVPHREEIKHHALESKHRLEQLVLACPSQIIFVRASGTCNFGRMLAELFPADPHTVPMTSFNHTLLQEGLAVVYNKK